jgi:hypothetical protein
VGSPLYELDLPFNDNGGVHTNSGIANKAAYLLGEPGNHTFNGRTVTGLGFTKSIHLWYRVMLGMTSGGDYEDLGNLLQVTCRRLVGNLGFTPGDCVEVDDAVAATEMITVHASGTEEAGMCDTAGQPITDVFFDGFESGAGNWTLSTRAQLAPGSLFPFRWAHSGVNAMYLNAEGPTSPSMTMKNFFTMPVSGNTYLWFAHLPFSGQPRLRLLHGNGATTFINPTWTGPPTRTGWGPETIANGYVSTRFNLTGFEGQFKIMFVLDPFFDDNDDPFGEWFIDDVHVYQCSDRPGPVRNLTAPRDPTRRTATVSWEPPLFPGFIWQYHATISPGVPGHQGHIVVDPGTTSVTFTGLNPGRRYEVQVQAFDTGGRAGDPATIPLDVIRSCFSTHLRDNPLWVCPSVPTKPTPFG